MEPKITVPEDLLTVNIETPIVDTNISSTHIKTKGAEHEKGGRKFKLPSLGFKGPEVDLSKTDVDVKLPETTVEVELPDVELKKTSTEIKSPEIQVSTNELDGSPSRFKMPTFKLPKFGVRTKSLEAEIPDMDTDIKVNGTEITVPKEVLNVNIEAPTFDTNVASLDAKTKDIEHEKRGSKFKLPSLGFKGPNVDLSHKNVDVKLPEAKVEVELPDVELKKPSAEMEITAPDVALHTSDVEGSPSHFKLPTIRLPKFGATSPQVSVEKPDIDQNIEIKGPNVQLEGAQVEVKLPEFEVKGPSTSVSLPEGDAKSKKSGWTMPSFSFSKASAKAPEAEISLEAPKIDLTLPEAKTEVNLDMKENRSISKEDGAAPDFDAKLKKPRFSLPKISFSKPNIKAPEVDFDLPQVDVSLQGVNVEGKQPNVEFDYPEGEIKVDTQVKKFKLPKFVYKGPDHDIPKTDVNMKLPETKILVEVPDVERKDSSTEIKSPEIKLPTNDTDRSPSKFKLPSFKMQKFGVGTQSVESEVPDVERDIKLNKADTTVLEEGLTVITEASIVDATVPSIDIKMKESKQEKSGTKVKLPSLGFDGLDVDLISSGDKAKVQILEVEMIQPVSKVEKVEESKQLDGNVEPQKSPEKTGWFRFPKLSLSSPTEAVKLTEKTQQKETSPPGETGDEEISPISSVESSDAFADVSSTVTSEPVVPSLSSPTKVTVKYTDQTPGVTGNEEMISNIISSTARTELFSEVPDLPEKITILSSGASSSSEDTLRLKSSRIHVISSNIQATPEAERARLLTAVQIQSAEGLPQTSDVSWRVEDSERNKRMVFEKQLLTKTSEERSESKETIVITKQITRVFESSDAASSIQRLRDSVHSEKMRFFDEAEK
ncbi:neuroblast differentiation-associated protein AHNAK-like [Gouania willdenowi]|uniref:neuroblast differentiation-associated protein AHNAK-like n=1 Tax=Gouania willdenowi TaxID=441366 RepID=UPI0010551EA1|nr:neuroblast differentiation-associated protein AHNAK-like [Gouania willdenowi]